MIIISYLKPYFSCKLLVFDNNTWNHITVCKQMIIIIIIIK